MHPIVTDKRLWEKNIRTVTPYVPGEQPNTDGMIKLNANENPYPPAPGVKQVLEDLEINRFRLYPDVKMSLLVNSIADAHKLNDNQVFVGVGSDDVLAMAFMTFFNGNKPILFPDITYSFYPVWSDLFKISYETPPLNSEFKIVKEDYFADNGGIIIANPNAPTGYFETLDTIEDILNHNQDVIVIIDEAYIDFGGVSARSLIDRYDNLLVVQTFSKSRSMAGMRIGYAMGHPLLVQALNNVKYSFNSYTMNEAAIAAGAAAMRDEAYFNQCVDRIMRTREWVGKELLLLGFHYIPSATNFIFATHEDYSAKVIFEELRKRNIYIRYFNLPRINNYVRITIGTEEEMVQFITVLKDLVKVLITERN